MSNQVRCPKAIHTGPMAVLLLSMGPETESVESETQERQQLFALKWQRKRSGLTMVIVVVVIMVPMAEAAEVITAEEEEVTTITCQELAGEVTTMTMVRSFFAFD